MRDYWRSRVTTDLDLTTGLVRLRVQTFSPDVTLKVTRAILADCEALINRLSEQARRDAVRFAEEDVQSAEQRLKAARLAITHFRNRHGVIDPMKTAEANLALIAKLEADAVQAQAQVLAADLDRQSPTRRNAEASISALKQQIAALRRELAAQLPDSEVPSASRPLSSLVTEYQELELEREFADRHYLKSLSTLEAARQDAARTQRYLVVHVQPRLPDEPLEPRRIWAIIGIAAGSLALAAMAAIASKTVREHVG
jgi:capsular polysaccharide transport system permease protein